MLYCCGGVDPHAHNAAPCCAWYLTLTCSCSPCRLPAMAQEERRAVCRRPPPRGFRPKRRPLRSGTYALHTGDSAYVPAVAPEIDAVRRRNGLADCRFGLHVFQLRRARGIGGRNRPDDGRCGRRGDRYLHRGGRRADRVYASPFRRTTCPSAPRRSCTWRGGNT